ncbi:MAG: hypothetical protein RG741_06020 [Bacteroidales bacterium]|nr:hypothetical protein [Bacteroidales bacterium]
MGEAASVGLVSLFVPLTAGLFWKKAGKTGALASIFAGMGVWLIAQFAGTRVAPIIYGLMASAPGMIFGSLTDKKRGYGLSGDC